MLHFVTYVKLLLVFLITTQTPYSVWNGAAVLFSITVPNFFEQKPFAFYGLFLSPTFQRSRKNEFYCTLIVL